MPDEQSALEDMEENDDDMTLPRLSQAPRIVSQLE